MSQKTIWKYTITLADHFILTMPKNAKILSFQVQYGTPQIWVLLDPSENGVEERAFSVVGTGNPADHVKASNYIGTCIMPLVKEAWHLFEIEK